jgi:hypothetical protein
MKHYNVTITITETSNWRQRGQEDITIAEPMIGAINWDTIVRLAYANLQEHIAADAEDEAGAEDGN